MRKTDIETHWDHGLSHPAVNIKVDLWHLGEFIRDVGGADFLAWWESLEEGVQEDMVEAVRYWATEDGFEQAKELASDIFSQSVEIWQKGRSGGWLVVQGLPDIDTWDAIMVSRWGRFHKAVSAIVNDFPYTVAGLIHANLYEL